MVEAARNRAHNQENAPRPMPGAVLVPTKLVERDPNQPRRDWRHDDAGARLDELVQSIKEFGVLQPLLVRREGDGYVVITGGRRLVAAKRASLAELPVVVRDENNMKVRVLQLVENVQRQDLSPMDEARAYQELLDLEGLSAPAVARRIHVSAQHVRDRLRLLRDQILADAVERHQIAASVAREIGKLPDEVADALRDDVQRGARLQLSDVGEARQRLAAAGIANPRRKAPPRPEEPVMPEQAPTAPRRPALPSQTDAVAATVEAPALPRPSAAPVSQPYQPPARPMPETETPQRAVSTKTVRPLKEAQESAQLSLEGAVRKEREVSLFNRAEKSDSESVTLAALVANVDLAVVEPLLFYGVDHGWSCAGLLQEMRSMSKKLR